MVLVWEALLRELGWEVCGRAERTVGVAFPLDLRVEVMETDLPMWMGLAVEGRAVMFF